MVVVVKLFSVLLFFLNAKSKCCLTVNPGHGDGFKENGDEDGKSGCEAV